MGLNKTNLEIQSFGLQHSAGVGIKQQKNLDDHLLSV
jgi:hypothetical protein